MALEPGAISELSARLPRGSVVISATNGKTTTAAMVASVLRQRRRSGRPQPSRREHGRRRRLDAARRGPRRWADRRASSGCSRSTSSGSTGSRPSSPARDPARQSVPRSARPLRRARDDRRPLGRGDATCRSDRRRVLVLNADDPLIADLGRDAPNMTYFGIEDPSVAMPEMQHASDSKHCRRCGAAYVYDAIYLGHLGRYRCPSCGQRRPAPSIAAERISLDGTRRSSFELDDARRECHRRATAPRSLQRLQRARRRRAVPRARAPARQRWSPACATSRPRSAAPSGSRSATSSSRCC